MEQQPPLKQYEWNFCSKKADIVILMQSGASTCSRGSKDADLVSSPGRRTATIVTYCPSRASRLAKKIASEF